MEKEILQRLDVIIKLLGGEKEFKSASNHNDREMILKTQNVLNPKLLTEYLISSAGEKVIMNIISRNRKAFKELQ